MLSHLKLNSSAQLTFISDLHLSPSHPLTLAFFVEFLNKLEPQHCGALLILGDLFEAWWGDDLLEQPQWATLRAAVDALAQLERRGIPLYILPGNRDFLIGPAFARLAHAHLLSDPCTLMAFGQTILLSHGDLLCSDDRMYQFFRKIVHHPKVQQLFLALPLAWRQSIADGLRRRSQKWNTTQHRQQPHLGDVTETAVLAQLEQYDLQTLIHGHTHRPQWHHHLRATHPGEPATRIVLSDWDLDHAESPRADALHWDNHGFHREQLL